MRRWLVLALASCGAPSSVPDGGVDAGVVDAGLTTFQQQVLSAHDAIRANAMPVPSPALPAMQWSASAQALAEDWAARCNFMHRDPNSLGENLSGSTQQQTPTIVVNDWASEKARYTYATNSCASGQECGHYTQLVWRASVGVGCAQQRCTTGSPFGSGTWFFFVCDYDPAGNFIGQKPY